MQNCSCSSGPAQAVGGVCQQVGAVQAPISALGAGLEQALGDGALPQPSPEKNLEELSPRIVRGAEENFVREAKKLRGDEGEGEVRSYHTASSGHEPSGGMVPPVPSLQKPSTLPHQLAVSSGQPGSLQHAVPHQASMVDAGNGVHQRGAAAFDQGMGVRWGQPTSRATGNSPGIPASEWVAYGQPQSFGGHGPMLNPQGSTAGLIGQAQHQGGVGL